MATKQVNAIIASLRANSNITDLLDTDYQDNHAIVYDLSDWTTQGCAIYVEAGNARHGDDLQRRITQFVNIFSCGNTIEQAAAIDQAVYEHLQYLQTDQHTEVVDGVTIWRANCVGGPLLRPAITSLLFPSRQWINYQRTYRIQISD